LHSSYLDVSNNIIKDLPQNIPEGLEALNLAYNRLITLQGLEVCSSLKRLGKHLIISKHMAILQMGRESKSHLITYIRGQISAAIC